MSMHFALPLEPSFPALAMTVLPFAMLGGVLGLDMVSFPQCMISRPLVSATLGGAFAGRIASGLLIGVILELIALETLPFGASRYAEWGSAGVVGGAVFAAQPVSTNGTLPGALPVAVFAALAAAMFSSRSMVMLRYMTAGYARRKRSAIDTGAIDVVQAIHLRGLVMDFLRAFGVTAISLLIFLPLSYEIVSVWKTDAVHSRAFVTAIAATIAAGAVWKIFHSTARAGWLFLVGLAIGGTLVVLR